MDEVKDTALGVAKSKTIYVGIFAPILLILAKKFGWDLTADEAAIIMGGLMIILRFLTNNGLKDK